MREHRVLDVTKTSRLRSIGRRPSLFLLQFCYPRRGDVVIDIMRGRIQNRYPGQFTGPEVAS